ncbi:hypothetical protein BH09PSE2_BH09PSE2_25020 [soil metagenome]
MRRNLTGAVIAVALLSLAACAHGGGPGAPETLPTDRAPDGRARMFADCVTQAAAGGAVMRFGSYLRYRCSGAPAKALYDEAQAFSQARKLEFVEGPRTTRRFNKTVWDDQCWTEGGAYGCLTTQPMNRDFVNGRDVPEAKAK